MKTIPSHRLTIIGILLSVAGLAILVQMIRIQNSDSAEAFINQAGL